MLKLCQAIALETGIKNKTYAKLNDLFKTIQKPALLSGLSRSYQPADDDGERFPSESTQVQVSAEDTLQQMATALARQWDITATRDWGNTFAQADVTIDGTTLLAGAPVPYLLFLAKQLKDWRDVIVKLPIHDPADRWTHDPSTGWWRTDPVTTNKTRKVPRNHVKAPATDKHPAQVELYYEDVTVGHWSTTKFTGGVPADRRAQLLARVEDLQEAVIRAREEANSTEVPDQKTGDQLLSWLLASPVSAS